MKLGLFSSLISLAFIAGCAQKQKYMGHEVIDQKFVIAGGKEITTKVTRSGPIPAQNDLFKIEVAGFSVGPSKEEPGKSAITWGFAFTAKTGAEVEKVEVELVYPGEESKRFVLDTAPQLSNRVWRGNTDGTVINSNTTPWLYESGTSTFLFKFTIHSNSQVSELYQPSSFPEQSKVIFRKMAEKNG